MQTYKIRSGDTLSQLAQRFHSSVSALQNANRAQIKNPDLIYAGNTLKVPGATSTPHTRDTFTPSTAARSHATGAHPTGGTSNASAPGGSSGSAALDTARSVLGKNIDTLKSSGPLSQYLDKGVNNHVCCANFVSAVLQKNGQLGPGMHDNSVKGLASKLSNSPNWQTTSLANAKPGDVVAFNVPGEGPMSHVEIFAGFKNGQPTFIGSNNVNPDGSQRISEGPANYPIGGVYHYAG